MTPRLPTSAGACPGPRPGQQGSILVIVLWIAFGLVALALYFAHAMRLELRAADHRIAGVEAAQAILGAARYASNLLANPEVPGALPDAATHLREDVPLGDAAFWFIGRGDEVLAPDEPSFGLRDESAKLNLNTATIEMLQWLPAMTPELAAAIVDWRDEDSTADAGGAEDDVYQRQDPPYRCKNAPFETIDELRLVYGMTLDLLEGEDTNRNGVLDPHEDDADLSPPPDNRDGRLDPGLLEYVTVYSRQPTTRTNGEPRIPLRPLATQQLSALLQERFGADRANQVLRNLGNPTAGFRSVLEFYLRSGLTADEFPQIEADVAAGTNAVAGLVNVNTASETVLACIPGIGFDLAPTLVAQRRSNPPALASLAWVADVLGETNALAAGPYLTGQTYQVTADIAAVGHHGRGYHREKFVFDTSDGAPRLVYRQDLTHLGWALGRDTRRALALASEAP